jgi:predicted phosphodiesterase
MKERPNPFPDKKRPDVGFDYALEEAKRRKEYIRSVEVSQSEATWMAYGEYPHLPIGIVYLTDIHFGGAGVDYDTLTEDFETILSTPNMFLIMGGDIIDAFSPTKHPSGMAGDIFNPDEQLEYMMDVMLGFDRRSKLGAVHLGNHDHWTDLAGYRFDRFLSELNCPIFQGSGNLNVIVGNGEKYRIFLAHTHWGNSKINITNSAKRALQFTSPDADIALLGHTHQASAENFVIGGKQKIAVVGGTYKVEDGWASRWGFGKAPIGGYTLMLYPNTRHMEVLRRPQTASDNIINAIRNAEEDGYVDPYTELIQRLNARKERRGK